MSINAEQAIAARTQRCEERGEGRRSKDEADFLRMMLDARYWLRRANRNRGTSQSPRLF